MGSRLDARRCANIRRDNFTLQTDIAEARELIFLHGFSVRSARVEKLLKNVSMQPTQVRLLHDLLLQYLTADLYAERILCSALTFRFQPLFAIPRRFHARS